MASMAVLIGCIRPRLKPHPSKSACRVTVERTKDCESPAYESPRLFTFHLMHLIGINKDTKSERMSLVITVEH